MDNGDYIVIINAEKVKLTGNKENDKVYRRHSGYPGGLQEKSARTVRASHPERLLILAVRGMLPKGPLGRKLLSKLKVYAGDKHPHTAQQSVTQSWQ